MTRKWMSALAAALAMGLAGCGGGSGVQPTERAETPRAAGTFTGSGTWWNPAEPGSGFFIEAQGGTAVVAFFVYDAGGNPVWYMASGPLAALDANQFSFAASLLQYSGGQAATSTAQKTPTSADAGQVQIVFNGESAQVQVPGRSYGARKFHPIAADPAAGGKQPETGIYWNPAEGGRGYTIEVNGGVATIGVFHYEATGRSTWNLVVGSVSNGELATDFTAYSGGQTLGGAYKAPVTVPNPGRFSASFASGCTGQIRLPGMAGIPVQRFPLGSLPAGAECRTGSAKPPTTPAPSVPVATPTTAAPSIPVATPTTPAPSTPVATPTGPQPGKALGTTFSIPQVTLKGNVIERSWARPELYVVSSEPIDPSLRVYFHFTDPPLLSRLYTQTSFVNNKMFLVTPYIYDEAPGVYSGVATLKVCIAGTASEPVCQENYANSPISVPYEITVRELGWSIMPNQQVASSMKSQGQQISLGFLIAEAVLTRVPYSIKTEATPPFTNPSHVQLSGDGFNLYVVVPPNTPAGRLKGTYTVKVCRDDAAVCAQPHKGSPFTIPLDVLIQ